MRMSRKAKKQSCGSGGCDAQSGQSGQCGPGGCGPGGCEPGACEPGAGAPLDGEYVASKLNLVSVQVPSMDAEHAECADALRKLATELSRASLETVQREFSEHFEHEEGLFDEHGFGGHKNERFSAKKTHIKDHHRLLDKIAGQLRSGVASVPQAFVRELLTDFNEHTSKYDVQYSEFLSSKGVK